MTERNDALAVTEATGLSGRAAEWTALAALHSGVFTRIQLRAWLPAASDAAARREASRIVTSLVGAELATEDELGGVGTFVHIHAKHVYRALGEPENRNRRKPTREKAIERLLCLDYVLDRPEEEWLPTERAKTDACEAAGIDRTAWPSKVYPARDGSGQTTRHFVEKFPLAIDPRGKHAIVGCVSAGTTTARAKSWIESYGPLIRALGTAGFAVELLHLSPRSTLSDAVAQELERAAARLGAADEDTLAIQKIKAAIRAETDEALESIGGLARGLETAREIYARRGDGFAAAPIELETQAWTSTRVALPESVA